MPFPPPVGYKAGTSGDLLLAPLDDTHPLVKAQRALNSIDPKALSYVLMNGSQNITPDQLKVVLQVTDEVAKVNYKLAIAIEYHFKQMGKV